MSKTKSPFRADLFAPQNLSTEHGIDSVLAEIRYAIQRKNYVTALSDVMASGDNMVLPLLLAPAAATSSNKEKSREHQENNRKRHLKHIMTEEHERLFNALELDPPVDQEEHAACVQSLMGTLHSLLDLYLKKLSEEDTINQITNHFTSYRDPAQNSASLPEGPSTDVVAAGPTDSFTIYNPLKANLKVHKPEGFGNWTIILATSNSRSDVRQWYRRDKKIFDTFEATLRELSFGHFSFDNQKALSGPDTEVPIYEAKVTGDLRLVYTIDCVSLYGEKGETQVIRVFGLFTHAELKRAGLWQRVANHLGKRGHEHTKRCTQRAPVAQRERYFDPITFPEPSASPAEQLTEEQDIPKSPLQGEDEEDLNEAHQLVSLNKYVPLSRALLHSILHDEDASFPFQISWDEREIIEWTKSCIILGRSGTGKTTTMLFKMLGLERAYQLSSAKGGVLGPSAHRPRQMFVTQSRVLAGKVKEQFFAYMDALSIVSEDFQGMSEQHKKLAHKAIANGDLIAEDDRDDWADGLPTRFSELEDKDFPLFITYDQLCSMIEGDLELLYEEEHAKTGYELTEFQNGRAEAERFVAAGKKMKGKLVNFRRFLTDYWPHFTQTYTKKLNPSVVFSEIVGVIFGSEDTIRGKRKRIERDVYESRRGFSSSMPSDLVSATYTLAEQYDKMKKDWDDFDVADRTHVILKAISSNKIQYRPQEVDYIYVDESQDNLIIDIYLLRRLCHDPNGMFWAGDTAQTIFMGSSMRFEDLKALLYRYEEKRHEARRAKGKASAPPEVPRMFHLSVNYRSHAGIVNCAHTIVELITKFWPDSIDKLNRERGQVDGQKPIFYTDTPRGFFESGQFLSKGATSGQRLEMGAEQCIIVRDEQAKKDLRDKIGDVGIILTLYQSKGLEFNDVLLYNFFQDSVAESSAWRVVLALSKSSEGPAFEPAKHAPLCHELKCLYVAITRARNVLRIADESNKGDYLKELWMERGQVLSRKPDDVADFAVQSKQEEWAAAADRLFKNDQYEEARRAYARAGMTKEENVAKAYHLREQAQSIPAGRAKKQHGQQFAAAARAFVACAGEAVEKKTSYHRIAAECFEEAGETTQAAKHFDLGGRHQDAARLYRRLGRFDKLFEILVGHSQEMDKGFVETLKDVVRLYYVKRKDFEKVHQLFESYEEELEYLEDRGLDYVQIDLMISHGRKADAADVHAKEGRYLDAIDLFLEDTSMPDESLERAKETILEALWTLYPLGITGDVAVEGYTAADIFDRANRIKTIFWPDQRLELEMFGLVRNSQLTPALLSLAQGLASQGKRHSAFFCFDHYFSAFSLPDNGDIAKFCEHLEHFADYTRILHDLAFIERPSSKEIQVLFGMRKRPQGDFFVLPSSPLTHDPRVRDSNNILSNDQLLDCFSEMAKGRLLDHVGHVDYLVREARSLSPCIAFALSKCEKQGCTSKKVHVKPDPTWYNFWVKAHLIHVGIFHLVTKVWLGTPESLNTERRYWIQRLHEVLRPRHHRVFGSMANLTQDVVDKLKDCRRVLVEWNRDTAYKLTLSSEKDKEFFTLALQTADLAFTFDKRLAVNYISHPTFLLEKKSHTHKLWQKLGGNRLTGALSCFSQKPKTLSEGIVFLEQVLDRRISIKWDVFLTFIERLCSFLVAAYCCKTWKSFHSLTLPRSRLFDVMFNSTFDSLKAQEISASQIRKMAAALGRLLTHLVEDKSGSAYLHDSSRPEFKNGTPAEQEMFKFIHVSRICVCLGILGVNAPTVPECQKAVWSAFQPAREPSSSFPSAECFTVIESAQELAIYSLHSLAQSKFDEFWHLYEAAFNVDPPDIPSGRNIVFVNNADLIRQLTEAQGLTKRFNLEEGEGDVGAGWKIRDEAYSEDDIKVIERYQKIYRRKLINRGLAQRTTLVGRVTRHYLACSKRVRKEQWPRSRYRVLFLGPLPNLLASLDSLSSLLLSKKAELKTRLSDETAKDGALEDVSNSLTRVAKLVKDVERFQRKLRPDSPYHKNQSVKDLTKDVADALHLFRGTDLPCALPDELHSEISLVFKAVLKERNPIRECLRIQMAFRRYQRAKRISLLGLRDSPAHKAITKEFAKYLPLVQSNPTMVLPYRVLLLGILPHVNVLLRGALSGLEEDLRRIREEVLWQATRAQAKALQARQEELKSLWQDISDYMSEVAPDAIVHTQCDVDTCKWLVQEAFAACQEYETVDGEPLIATDGYQMVVGVLSRL